MLARQLAQAQVYRSQQQSDSAPNDDSEESRARKWPRKP